MKISVSSYSFLKYYKATNCTYFDLCDKAKEMGFAGIEFFDLKGEDLLNTAREIRRYCEAIGLPIVAYAVPANFMAEDIESEVQRVCALVDVCEELGSPIFRHDVCGKLPDNPPSSWEDAVIRMAPQIRRVSEYALSKGIRTCTENHGYVFQHPERMESLIRAVNFNNYGWLCDIGNFLCVDADVESAVKTAAPYTFHVHVKDFLYKKETERPEGFFPTAGNNWLCGTVLGQGVVPVEQCIRILQNSGYNGWITLEFEGEEDCLASIETGLRVLKNYI